MTEVDGAGTPDVGRALHRAALLLVAALPVVLVLGAFMWRIEGTDLVIGLPVAWAVVAGPVLLAVIHTRRRMARMVRPAFDPAVLARSGHYAAGALVGFFALGYLGILVGAPLLLAASATFAAAWVRPRGPHVAGDDFDSASEDAQREVARGIVIRLVGAALPVVLFIGALNIDERPVVGAILLTMALSALLRLWMLRRQPTDHSQVTPGQ